MSAVRTGRCPSCGTATVAVRDQDTRELVVLDEQRVDGGTVQVLAVGPIVVVRQLGRPATVQPAYQRHRCAAVVPDVEDRDDPGIEQARWRQP